MMLILIGSDRHMMERLESYERPLHGRLRPFPVEPLNPAETAAMTGADALRALDAYCVVGGFPQLASTWRDADTVERYLRRELADPTSPLVVTGERVIAAELPPQSTPRAVVSAIDHRSLSPLLASIHPPEPAGDRTSPWRRCPPANHRRLADFSWSRDRADRACLDRADASRRAVRQGLLRHLVVDSQPRRRDRPRRHR